MFFDPLYIVLIVAYLMPVVILSSSREESDLVRSWDLGANAYAVKPVDIDQFFTAIKTLGTFWALLNQAPERN